jgi:hypothetical protein
MTYSVNFELTNQSGNLFSHSERYTVAGLARVHVRERKSERFTDWSGTVTRYRATSQRPFVICVLSDHTNEDSNGETVDHSEVRTYEGKIEEMSEPKATREFVYVIPTQSIRHGRY